ncbi:MAG: pyrimidine/purine nucleoside phosphorylase [Cytophagales bacterium]|nr:pyrimidine/purine nucleoside phosphorylase [Cytophagales bacterium]
MFKINHYFDNKVSSIAYDSAEGASTVGVMKDGEYEFGTSQHEVMTVVQGKLTVLLPNETEWKSFVNGESFSVEANASFKVKAEGNTSYLCQYS